MPTKSMYPYLLVLLVVLASVINSDLFFNLHILGDQCEMIFRYNCMSLNLAPHIYASDTCTRIFCVCSASASPSVPCYRSSQDKQVHN